MGGIISSIEPDSIAVELGWRIGDEIVSINGHDLHDIIDYRFYSSDEFLTVAIRRGEKSLDYEFEKDVDLDLGVEFKDVLFDGVRLCGAKCVFCFVEQLPKGLRKSLYLKDDDFRLSFLDGNFITLANLTRQDLHRIVTQRLSPLYVSVHTTDPELRTSMLGRDCPSILDQIDYLARGRIALHTQIVLCRGINDGERLDRTIDDLASRHPTVASIAVVPAGVTRHRRNRTPIGAIDAQYSRKILYKIGQWQKRFQQEKGTRLVWAADEFYLNAGRRVPSASTYEGFPQIENGVGLVRKFKDSASHARRLIRPIRNPKSEIRNASIVTGELAASMLEEWAQSLADIGIRIDVHAIKNRFFGDTVTVAGLIGGRDVINQLRDAELGAVVFVPSVAVRDGAFLDDVTVADAQAALGRRVVVVEPLPHCLLRAMLAELG